MSDQLDLFSTGQLRSHIDPAAAVTARDEAISAVETASPGMASELSTIVLAVARATADFTTDDVWAALGDRAEQVTEPRVLGAVMRTLARSNHITPAGGYRNSNRPACHARPVKVWRAAEEATR